MVVVLWWLCDHFGWGIDVVEELVVHFICGRLSEMA